MDCISRLQTESLEKAARESLLHRKLGFTDDVEANAFVAQVGLTHEHGYQEPMSMASGDFDSLALRQRHLSHHSTTSVTAIQGGLCNSIQRFTPALIPLVAHVGGQPFYTHTQ